MRAGEQTAGEIETARAVRLALTRHQHRRAQGIPTLSVLVGEAALAVDVWREWTQAAGWVSQVRQIGGLPGEWSRQEALGAGTLFVFQGDDASREEANRDALGKLARAVEALCRRLEAAGADQRNQPLALAVTPADAAAFLRDEPYSRARTLFAEGMVSLSVAPDPVRPPAGRGGGSEDAAALLARNVPSLNLQKHPLQAQTLASFDAAVAALRQTAPDSADAVGEEDDRARSAAERFLFDLLNELPETAGLFELNVRLDFCFGPKRMEVDLLAAGLRLAVEIDGYYHFQDQENYRRDRRKDALLQRQGYLVLRFLAEDVVTRLENILEEVRTTVAFRRATGR